MFLQGRASWQGLLLPEPLGGDALRAVLLLFRCQPLCGEGWEVVQLASPTYNLPVALARSNTGSYIRNVAASTNCPPFPPAPAPFATDSL